jgi:hypothetical protein
MDFFDFAEIVRARVADAFPAAQIEGRLDNIPIARWRNNEQRAQFNRIGDSEDGIGALYLWKRGVPVNNHNFQQCSYILNQEETARVADDVINWLRQE